MESDEWNFIYIGPMEGVSCVIRPCFCIFLCDHLVRSRHDLEYNSLPISLGFKFNVWNPSGGSDIPILWCPFDV